MLGNEVSRDVLAIEQSRRTELTLESLDPRKDYPKPELIELIVDIQVDQIKGWVTKVGSLLNPYKKWKMKWFLRRNYDVFAWSVAHMLGISFFVICHSLNVNLSAQSKR